MNKFRKQEEELVNDFKSGKINEETFNEKWETLQGKFEKYDVEHNKIYGEILNYANNTEFVGNYKIKSFDITNVKTIWIIGMSITLENEDGHIHRVGVKIHKEGHNTSRDSVSTWFSFKDFSIDKLNKFLINTDFKKQLI